MVGSGVASARCVATEERPAHHADGTPTGSRGYGDLNEAFIMEHIWHAIFGQPLDSPPHRGDETCRFARCGVLCPHPATPELGMLAGP